MHTTHLPFLRQPLTFSTAICAIKPPLSITPHQQTQTQTQLPKKFLSSSPSKFIKTSAPTIHLRSPMEKSQLKPRNLAPVLLLACLIIFFPSSSSARRLNVPQNPAADQPALYLVLPADGAVVVAFPLEKDGSQAVFPCEMEESGKPKPAFPASPRLAGKYGPMVLTMLPKGQLPSSGPSKGTNSVHN